MIRIFRDGQATEPAGGSEQSAIEQEAEDIIRKGIQNKIKAKPLLVELINKYTESLRQKDEEINTISTRLDAAKSLLDMMTDKRNQLQEEVWQLKAKLNDASVTGLQLQETINNLEESLQELRDSQFAQNCEIIELTNKLKSKKEDNV